MHDNKLIQWFKKLRKNNKFKNCTSSMNKRQFVLTVDLI